MVPWLLPLAGIVVWAAPVVAIPNASTKAPAIEAHVLLETVFMIVLQHFLWWNRQFATAAV
jgi:hypothetical protein